MLLSQTKFNCYSMNIFRCYHNQLTSAISFSNRFYAQFFANAKWPENSFEVAVFAKFFFRNEHKQTVIISQVIRNKIYFLYYAQEIDDIIKSFTGCRMQPTPNQTKTILTICELTTLLKHQHNYDQLNHLKILHTQ